MSQVWLTIVFVVLIAFALTLFCYFKGACLWVHGWAPCRRVPRQ